MDYVCISYSVLGLLLRQMVLELLLKQMVLGLEWHFVIHIEHTQKLNSTKEIQERKIQKQQ